MCLCRFLVLPQEFEHTHTKWSHTKYARSLIYWRNVKSVSISLISPRQETRERIPCRFIVKISFTMSFWRHYSYYPATINAPFRAVFYKTPFSHWFILRRRKLTAPVLVWRMWLLDVISCPTPGAMSVGILCGIEPRSGNI